jgi:outer membrane protein OmpA-like peptidoglycan-associated protein
MSPWKMRSALWASLVSVCLAGAAFAEGPSWQYEATPTVAPGKPAALSLRSANGAFGVTLTLRSDAGVEKVFNFKQLKPGKPVSIKFSVPEGVSRWTGTLEGSAEGTTTTSNIELKVVSAGALDVKFDKKDVDLETGRIRVRPNHAVSRVEIQVFTGDEKPVIDGEADVHMEGADAIIAFEPPEATVERVELKLHDDFGYWAALRIASWLVEIAHDDVVFESGKAGIRPAEATKVDAAITALAAELAKYRARLGNAAADVDVRVYVAGYTDTVGSPADNLRLSGERAEAIARYFRAHGVSHPIYHQGFGEAALAAPTDDEVDEPRNRRATYVLSNVAPRGPAFPGAHWKRL